MSKMSTFFVTLCVFALLSCASYTHAATCHALALSGGTFMHQGPCCSVGLSTLDNVSFHTSHSLVGLFVLYMFVVRVCARVSCVYMCMA
jgi:hypothetical protein